MADTILNLILRLKKQGNGAQEARADLGGMVRGLADVKAGFEMAGQVWDRARQVLDATVGRAAAWGDEMGDLATKTGMTVREASTMATVFENVGLSMQTLEAAAKAAAKNGIQFNMETLRKLSAQYQAIESPVERSRFAMEQFGRAGLEMTEILARDTANLSDLERQARMTGKVIGEDAAAQAEKFNQSMKQLTQMAEGFQIFLGNAVIPTLVDAGQGFQNLALLGGALGIAFADLKGEITSEEAAIRAAALAGGDLAAGYMTTWKPAVDEVTDSTAALTYEWTNLTPPLDVATAAMATAAAVAKGELEKNIDDLTGAASDLKFGMGELTTATLFNQAAAGLDAEASYALAKSMGLIKPDADAAKQVLDELRAEFERGDISAGQYQGSVKLLDMAIRSLPDGKTITITYLEQYIKDLNNDRSLGGGGADSRIGGAIGDGYASGGSFVVPAGYPNDTYPLRVSSGELVTVTPANQVTNNYNLNMTSSASSLGISNDFALMRAMASM